MADKTYIYALACPLEHKVRYIGKADVPEERYLTHANMTDLSRAPFGMITPKQEWIRSLRTKGRAPELVILEEVGADPSAWRAAERNWIERMLVAASALR